MSARKKEFWAKMRSPQMKAIGRIAAVAESGDAQAAQELVDELLPDGRVAGLTDWEIEQLRGFFLDRVRDTEMIIRALAEPDPQPPFYDVLVNSKSPRERLLARKMYDAWHEGQR